MTIAVKIAAEPERFAIRPQAMPDQLVTVGSGNNPPRILWASPGVEPEDLRYTGYFKKLIGRHKFLFGDRIEVRGHDRSWRADLTVLASTPQGLEVHFDKVTQLKAPTEIGDSDGVYTTRHDGGAQPWVIVRDAGGAIMPHRYATRDAARVARAKLHPKTV